VNSITSQWRPAVLSGTAQQYVHSGKCPLAVSVASHTVRRQVQNPLSPTYSTVAYSLLVVEHPFSWYSKGYDTLILIS